MSFFSGYNHVVANSYIHRDILVMFFRFTVSLCGVMKIRQKNWGSFGYKRDQVFLLIYDLLIHLLRGGRCLRALSDILQKITIFGVFPSFNVCGSNLMLLLYTLARDEV